MLTATCFVVGTLAFLEIREFRQTWRVNLSEVRSIERDPWDISRTRIDIGAARRSDNIITRVPPRRILAALRNCGPRQERPAREPYSPPMAPPANIRSVDP
jgi:hypothetical protein